VTSGVSVVVTAGQGGRALLITADSIASQRASASDLALVTATTHPNPPLLESVAARQSARVVAPDGRPGAALNRAIRAGAGDVVAVVPAGFILPSTFIERCSIGLGSAPEIAALAPGVEVQTPDGLGSAVWMPEGVDAAAVLADPASVPPVLVIRRAAVEAIGGFAEDLDALVELDLWLRLTLSGRRVAPLLHPLVVRELGVRTATQLANDDDYLLHLREVLVRHEGALAEHMHHVLVARELRFGQARERHRTLIMRRDNDLAELDALRAAAAHDRAYLEHHGAASLDWGDLRRIDPISRDWGYERGTPVDRRYIDAFLAAHSSDVRGAVLEVQEDDFTGAFGGPRVTASDVLDIDPSNDRATVFADLRWAPGLASERFDCIILTQTLHVINDIEAALRECYRLLKPGGVLLSTLPAASRTCLEYGQDGDLWRVTPAGARRLVQVAFRPSQASFDTYGNILTNTAFLHGLAAEELTDEEFAATDPYFPAITGVRARKSNAPERVAPRGVVLLYHRLDDVVDLHDVSVPAGLFERHLQWLQANCTVMPVSDLLTAPPEALPERAVGITFDDGYLDNLTVAAPLLSKYGAPATFFVTSRWLDSPGEYWWDTFERALRAGADLGGPLEIDIDGRATRFPLVSAEERQVAHSRLHTALVHASLEERDRLIDALRRWSGVGTDVPTHRRPMLAAEVYELSRVPGVHIGGHTVNHLALPDQAPDVQEREVSECRFALESITRQSIELFAYPYGAVDRQVADRLRRSHHWALSCDTGRLGDSFDAARVPRLEVARLELPAFSAAVERMFQCPGHESRARITRLPD
jgi:peptidoglycan/xylan/chitin deacetylase (PgdA/CDA1 family)